MFAVVDCDNCFVSCERVFQPDLKGRPVVVLSNNDGCVVARSNEAKALGIKMGVPFYQIRDLIQRYDVQARSSNYVLYADMSNRLMSILRDPEPLDPAVIITQVEQYSIDEAFLSLSFPQCPVSCDNVAGNKTIGADTPSDPGYGAILPWARALTSRILQWTGLPVSIGIAPTRTLAKVATWFAKHYPAYGKVCLIADDSQRQKALQLLDISEVWGVGRHGVDKYRYFGIQTAWDLTQRSESWVRQHFTVTGARTWRELRGISCIDTVESGEKQSICTSRSFDGMVAERGRLEMFVSNYAAHCAAKLRSQHSVCSLVTCFAQTNHHRLDLAQMDASLTVTLPTPASSTHEIVAAALRALRAFYREGYFFKRAGVILSGISSDRAVQQDLFDALTPEQRQKLNRLSQVIDTVNRRHGADTLQLGVQQFPLDPASGQSLTFRDLIRHDHRSRCYTTNLDEVITVK